MFSFEGEYSHPYIDQEINLPGMREYVQSLIDEEKQKVPQEEPKIDIVEYKKSEGFVPKEFSSNAYYEDLLQQKELLEIMLSRRSEYWRKEIRQLQKLVYSVEEEINGVKSDIDEVTIKRKELQESHITRLHRLKERKKQLKESIDKLKGFIEEGKNQM